jgi:hypothetical protein
VSLRLVEAVTLQSKLVDEGGELLWCLLVCNGRNQPLDQRHTLGEGETVRVIDQSAELGVIHPIGTAARGHQVLRFMEVSGSGRRPARPNIHAPCPLKYAPPSADTP